MRQRAYTPHTVLAGGIARLGDALPANPFKPTKPDKTMPNPTKPSKPAKVKTLPKDEDYSTPYAPPVAPPVVKESLTVAQPADVPELDDIVIDDGIALPQRKNPKVLILKTLITRLQPGQSAKLGLHMRCSLGKVTSAANQAGEGRFVTCLQFDDDKTLRVWRVA